MGGTVFLIDFWCHRSWSRGVSQGVVSQCGQICDRGHGVVTGSPRVFISGHQVTALKLLFRSHRAQTWTRLSEKSNTS